MMLRQQGAKPCYMSSLLKALENPFQQQYGTPKQFEQNVLKWKLTEKAKAQQPAGRKHTTDVFGCSGIFVSHVVIGLKTNLYCIIDVPES